MIDERQDDEILGRALARAIETIEVNETAYERSRFVSAPSRRLFGLWQLASGAAAVILALAFGLWLTRPNDTQEPAAGSLKPAPTATASPQLAIPVSSAAPDRDNVWVYFTRDSLPPLGAYVRGVFTDGSREVRIASRLSLLRGSRITPVPAGASNPLALVAPVQNGSSTFGVGARIDGETASVEFEIPTGWGIHGATQSRALLQQLVYVITEEAGVRYARITEQGKANAVIDGLVVDKPLSREDVFGYTVRAATGSISFGGDDKTPFVGADLVTRDIQDGTLVRLTFEGRNRSTNAKASLPSFTISFQRNDGSVPHNRADGAPPAYLLAIGFQWNGTGSSGGVGHVERVDRAPLRLIAGDGNTSYQLGLDDARPWRAYMPDPTLLIIEIGGDPRTVSDRIAVTAPKPGDRFAGDIVRATGSARVFEANVSWRLRDANEKAVANGHFNASLGTSQLWGTFEASIAIPPGLHGSITLEVYEVSPQDGSDRGMVKIPLTVS
jgi:hypothetical protein